MRELVVEGQEVLIIPQNFKNANKGVVKSVSAGEFELELKYSPENLLKNTRNEMINNINSVEGFLIKYSV